MITADVHRGVAAQLKKLSAFLTTDRLGSSADGRPISHSNCGNIGNTDDVPPCLERGTLACSKCHLVKYCSKECQLLHWTSKHRSDCKNPYLKSDWQPAWVQKGRPPSFFGPDNAPVQVPFGVYGNYVWGNVPAIDCLRIPDNEGESATTSDLKVCFAASGDIRNLVCTVNGLPDAYNGKLEILCNDKNSTVANRNLVVLFALLRDSPSLEEAAEVAVHLMYSSALTVDQALYLQRSIDIIYGGDALNTAYPSFALDIRGGGKLHASLQGFELRQTLDMFFSTYDLPKALENMRDVMLHPSRVDYRDRYLRYLQGGHRAAFMRFRELGLLLPFSAAVSHFNQPNRLLFSSSGGWLTKDDASPLFGWNVADVQQSGKRHGLDPADIFGSLFFHVKDELIKFAGRVRDFDITIHISQFTAKFMSQQIPKGTIRPFRADSKFDRVETSNMCDYVGIPEVINDWGPLMNRKNKYSTLLMYSMNWILQQPDGSLSLNPSGLQHLQKKSEVLKILQDCASALGLNVADVIGPRSFANLDFLTRLNAFYDNEKPFQQYLRGVAAERTAASNALKLRSTHRIHPKRFGLPLKTKPEQSLVPGRNLSKDEYYNAFVLGHVEDTVRYMEFETSEF